MNRKKLFGALLSAIGAGVAAVSIAGPTHGRTGTDYNEVAIGMGVIMLVLGLFIYFGDFKKQNAKAPPQA